MLLSIEKKQVRALADSSCIVILWIGTLATEHEMAAEEWAATGQAAQARG